MYRHDYGFCVDDEWYHTDHETVELLRGLVETIRNPGDEDPQMNAHLVKGAQAAFCAVMEVGLMVGRIVRATGPVAVPENPLFH